MTGAEQVTEPSTENGYNNICLPAPEAESKLYTINADQHRAGDSKDGPRIQDAAARALQAELDEKERGVSRVLVRVQDAAARALEQNKPEPPQAPSSPAVQEPTTKTAENCEPEVEQIV